MTTPRAIAFAPSPFRLRLLVAMMTALMLLAPPLVQEIHAAIPFSTGDLVTVTTDVLNVRSAPGTGTSIVDHLYAGERVTICAVDGWASGYEWVQVSRVSGSPIGWVAAEYLGLAGSSGTATFEIGDRVLIDAGAVNFRTGPTTGANVIRPLAYGTVLMLVDGPIVADGYTWFRGRTTAATGGETGWAIGEAMMIAPADMPDPCLRFDAGTPVFVNTGVLRLRAQASASGAILAALPYGTSLTVTGMPVGADGYTWYPVTTTAGTAGWVAGTYLAGGGGPGGGGGLILGAPARVDASSLNVRTGPGIAAGIQGQLASGTWLMLVSGPHVADGYHWYEVETANGESGWVIGEALITAP